VERHRLVGLNAWLGPLLAVLGVLGFSFKAILIKLAYAAAPVDPVTLLTLRMLYSAPFFVALAWWAGRAKGAAPIAPRDFRLLLALGFIGYYLSSLLDFLGLQYITASLERLVLFLYPTIVVVLSAIFLSQPVTRRATVALGLSYAGSRLPCGTTSALPVIPAPSRSAACSCSAARAATRFTWSLRAGSSPASDRRASSRGRCWRRPSS
jgi:uncharacterized membrane protein